MTDDSRHRELQALYVISVAAELAGVHPQTLRIPAGTRSGRTFRVKGRGTRAEGAPGDLLATVEVVVPESLTEAQRAAVEALAAASTESPRRHLGVE